MEKVVLAVSELVKALEEVPENGESGKAVLLSSGQYLNDEEHAAYMEDFAMVVNDVVDRVIFIADKHNVDRDNAFQHFATIFKIMTEISTFEGWGKAEGQFETAMGMGEGNTMADEKNFENRIKKYFHSVGIYPAGYPSDRMDALMEGWYTKIWGGGFQKSGIPDLICCVNGVMLAVEVKASSGRPSELQKLNIGRIRDSGGIGVFLYPSGFEKFKDDLEYILCHHEFVAPLNEYMQEIYK